MTNVSINVSAGAEFTNGNLGISFPPGFTTAANVNITITVATQAVTGLAGNVSASPNGTVVDIVLTNASTGQPITSLNTPLQVVVKPTAADLAMAGGDFSKLSAIYFVAGTTSPVFNPLGLPPGTPLFVTGLKQDPATGTISWQTQNTAGIIRAVVANPVSYVQTLNPNTQEWSTFDPNAPQQSFGMKPQFSYPQVVAPQIPVDNRLVVLDPDTGTTRT